VGYATIGMEWHRNWLFGQAHHTKGPANVMSAPSRESGDNINRLLNVPREKGLRSGVSA